MKVHEASLVSLLKNGPGILPSSIVVGRHRDDLILGALLRQVEELLLLRSDVEVETH